jgi:hypothetical protein
MTNPKKRLVQLNDRDIPRLKRRTQILRIMLALCVFLALWFAFTGDGLLTITCCILGFINTIMVKRNQSLLRMIENVFTLKT